MNVGRWVIVHAWSEPLDDMRTTPLGMRESGDGDVGLGLCKIAGEWRICLGRWLSDDPESCWDEKAWRPIAECSRDDRTRATEVIHRLAGRLAETAEEISSEVEQAVARLAEASNALKKASNGPSR
jgi:hypothetical protein